MGDVHSLQGKGKKNILVDGRKVKSNDNTCWIGQCRPAEDIEDRVSEHTLLSISAPYNCITIHTNVHISTVTHSYIRYPQVVSFSVKHKCTLQKHCATTNSYSQAFSCIKIHTYDILSFIRCNKQRQTHIGIHARVHTSYTHTHGQRKEYWVAQLAHSAEHIWAWRMEHLPGDVSQTCQQPHEPWNNRGGWGTGECGNYPSHHQSGRLAIGRESDRSTYIIVHGDFHSFIVIVCSGFLVFSYGPQ